MRLDLPWDASCQTGVVNAVGEIRQRVDAHGLGLAEAYGLIHSAPTEETGRLDSVVVQKFLRSRKGRRETTPRPRDGRSLMRAYAAQHFEREPS